MGEIIAQKYFMVLVLDNEYPEMDGLPSLAVCRVLVDGWYICHLYAPSKESAIDKFLSGNYEH